MHFNMSSGIKNRELQQDVQQIGEYINRQYAQVFTQLIIFNLFFKFFSLI